MSPCLTGGGRAYKLDFEMIASPSTSWISSSPSSTLSETSNSPIAISTRKPRTPRKRPNQTYNEAATLLSTAYPKIFSAKQLTKPCKFTKPHGAFSFENSELLPPFPVLDASGFLLQPPVLEKPNFLLMPKIKNSDENPCQGPGENDFEGNSWNLSTEYQEDLDAESILDGEIEEGIDSIMGNSSVNDSNGQTGIWYGHQIGLGFGRNFDWGFGMSRALRNVDDGGDWWRFPAVDVLSITPKFNTEKKKKKKTVPQKRLEKASSKGDSIPKASSEELEDSPNSGLLLKLNYSEVANAWSDRGSPFPNEVLEPDSAGNDVHVKLAQIDLFSDNGGVREASVLRYKEKRRSRLFSKKIRYQVRKVNADRRPRMKGRFVRRSNSPESEHT